MDKHQECWLLLTIAQCPTRDVLYSMRGHPNYHHNHQHQYQSIEYYRMGMHLQDQPDEQTIHLLQTNPLDLDLSNHHHQCPNNRICHCLIDQNYTDRSLPDSRLNYRQSHHYPNPATGMVGKEKHLHRCLAPIPLRGQNNHQNRSLHNPYDRKPMFQECYHKNLQCQYSHPHQYLYR